MNKEDIVVFFKYYKFYNQNVLFSKMFKKKTKKIKY